MFRLIKGCATLIGFIVLIAIGFWVWATYFRPQPAPLVVVPASPAAQGAPAPAAAAASPAQSLDARLASAEAQIRSNAATGKHAPVTFTVTDAELTARANQALANGEVQAPVTNLQVTSSPGTVAVKGQAKTVINLPFTITAVPTVDAGKAKLQVSSVDFGGLPVPGALSQQLTSLAGSDNLLGDLPLTVTSFRAEAGRVVLEGTT